MTRLLLVISIWVCFIGNCGGLGQEFVLDCIDQWFKRVKTLSAVAAYQLLLQSVHNLNGPYYECDM